MEFLKLIALMNLVFCVRPGLSQDRICYTTFQCSEIIALRMEQMLALVVDIDESCHLNSSSKANWKIGNTSLTMVPDIDFSSISYWLSDWFKHQRNSTKKRFRRSIASSRNPSSDDGVKEEFAHLRKPASDRFRFCSLCDRSAPVRSGNYSDQFLRSASLLPEQQDGLCECPFQLFSWNGFFKVWNSFILTCISIQLWIPAIGLSYDLLGRRV